MKVTQWMLSILKKATEILINGINMENTHNI